MTTTNYPRLFEPGFIGNLQVKNRIVAAPVCTNFAAPFGYVNDRITKYYVERARGGVGLIILENSKVNYPAGTILGHNLRLDNDFYLSSYQELAEALHFYDCKILAQIQHPGRQTKVQAVGPSPIPCKFLGAPVREMTPAEIRDCIEKFAEAALRTQKAGMDGVEFHGSHGYLINNFMSPYTNKRSDEWGGSFERRMKFMVEIVNRTREKVGADFPLCLRFSADEFVPGGITIEESKEIARTAEAAGVDVLHVSAGIYESMPTIFDTMRYKEGWRVYLAEEVKKAVKIPVIAVGQIKTPSYAEQVLEQGKADFIALGRPLIADAEWANKAAEGREEDIRKCTSCNHCFGKYQLAELYMRCAVNPVAGREKEEGWVTPKPAKSKKKVMVVGGGPAGMEAARVASLRGHDVVLYEKGDELGGQLMLAAASPGKDKINYIMEYYSPQLNRLGVKIHTGVEVTEQLIRKAQPDVVILATGAEPLMPNIPGISGANVYTYRDVLSRKVSLPPGKVVVAGGGMVGCETALFLAAKGNKVTIAEMQGELATDMEPVSRMDLLKHELPEAGIEILTGTTVEEISNKTVILSDREGIRSIIQTDNVVIALGAKSVENLSNKMKGIVPQVYVIGDSSKPRTIMEATYEGALTARLI